VYPTLSQAVVRLGGKDGCRTGTWTSFGVIALCSAQEREENEDEDEEDRLLSSWQDRKPC
jgi:hypothetical protein